MLESDIKKLTTAVQELTAALMAGTAISPATTTGVSQAVDNLAVTQQAQMDAGQQPIQQQPIQQQPIQQQPIQQQPIIHEAVATVLTQDVVVKHLTDAMVRLGADGQAKVVGALTANFGTHKVPEILPAQWPQVVAVVQQLV